MAEFALFIKDLKNYLDNLDYKSVNFKQQNLLFQIKESYDNAEEKVLIGSIWQFITPDFSFEMQDIPKIIKEFLPRQFNIESRNIFFYFTVKSTLFEAYLVNRSEIIKIGSHKLVFSDTGNSKNNNHKSLKVSLDLNKENVNLIRKIKYFSELYSNQLGKLEKNRLFYSALLYSSLNSLSEKTNKSEMNQMDSEKIAILIGKNSIFYGISITFLKQFYRNNPEQMQFYENIWRNHFNLIYNKRDLTSDFFLNHSYYSFILKILLFINYRKRRYYYQNSLDKSITHNKSIFFTFQTFLEMMQHYLKLKIPIFIGDPFFWVLNIKELLFLFNLTLLDLDFADEDLFAQTYQDFISLSTRQALGEVYSPKELIKLMIDKKILKNSSLTTKHIKNPENSDTSTKNQINILDPSCGSGSFILELIKNMDKKIKGIYGIDINPLAVQTAKCNLIIYLEKENQIIFDDLKDNNFDLGIHLGDALFPYYLENSDMSNDSSSKILSKGRITGETEIWNFNNNHITFSFAKTLVNSNFDQVQNLIFSFLTKILNKVPENHKISALDNPTNHYIIQDSDSLEVILEEIKKQMNPLSALFLIISFYNAYKIRVLSFNKVDAIIGNPPWINLSGIQSGERKIKLKNLSKELGIFFGIEAKNTEISTLFFFRIRDLFLRTNGIIFFILPASVLSGRQHVYFRYFEKFADIEVWKFREDIFRIHSICLYAKNTKFKEIDSIAESKKARSKLTSKLAEDTENKGIEANMEKRLKLRYILFELEEKLDNTIKYFPREDGFLIPAYIKWENRKRNTNQSKKHNVPMIGRYNPLLAMDSNKLIIPAERSKYYSKIYGGIRIVPRRWVVIQDRPPFKKETLIHPDLSQQAKQLWQNPPYSEILIESECIYPFLKSQGLIPFLFVKIEYGFLPLVKFDEGSKKFADFTEDSIKLLKPYAKEHYRRLNYEYKNRIKESASMKTLIDNFTYNNRLIPNLKRIESFKLFTEIYMVIHNSIGSIVKSTVVKDPILLDNSLYYFLTTDKIEAYYLTGVLNSPIITECVKRVGSTGSRGSLRNIHKNPYNFPIPEFNGSELHKNIADLAFNIEQYVRDFVLKYCKISNYKGKMTQNIVSFLLSIDKFVSARKIQKILSEDSEFRKKTERLNFYTCQLF